MSYKCPLCLTELAEGDRLVRFCTDHPQLSPTTVTLHDSEENLPDEIYCPGGDARCNSAIYPGVFLRHVGCEAIHPFSDGRESDVPGSGHTAASQSNNTGDENIIDSVTDYQLPTGQKIKVTHWEIGMLRLVPPSAEMWFPLMLLRATGETYRSNNGEKARIGVLVELAGARRVGKTVLAMQAMEYEGYVPGTSSDGRHVEVTGFMFSRLPPGKTGLTNPFLATLYYNNLMMRNDSGLFLLDETERMPGDVKAAFIAPSKETSTREFTSINTSAPPRADRKLIKAVGSNIWQLIKGVVEIFKPRIGPYPFWFTVAFYDVAGESFRFGDVTPDFIEKSIDRVAILIDAEETFGETKTSSIAIANERIGRVTGQRQMPHCLVVAKLDLIMDRLSFEEKHKVELIAEDLSKDYSSEARTLLTSWLSRRKDDESIKQLSNRLSKIEKIFFVWTKNLPKVTSQDAAQDSTRQPSSYGLAKFICWCLNIGWNDLNQK